jgi:hypothetical protein
VLLGKYNYKGRKVHTELWQENVNEIDNYEDLDIDGRLTINVI